MFSVYNNIFQDSDIFYINIILLLFFALIVLVYAATTSRLSYFDLSKIDDNTSIEYFLRISNFSLAIFIIACYMYFDKKPNADAISNKYTYISGIFSIILGFIIHHFLQTKKSITNYIIYHKNTQINIVLLNILLNLLWLHFWIRSFIDLPTLTYTVMLSTILLTMLNYKNTSSDPKTNRIDLTHKPSYSNFFLSTIIFMLIFWYIKETIYIIILLCSFTIITFPAKKIFLHAIRKYSYFADNTIRSTSFVRSHILIITIIFLLSFRLDFPFDYNHYSYIVLPAYSLAAGGTPLININSQYGIGILYFIDSLYLFSSQSISFTSFSFIVNILNIIFYVIILYIVWNVSNRILWIGYVFLALIVFNRFCQLGSIPELFPSTGFLRFGLPWIYLIYDTKRMKVVRKNIVVWLVIFVASAWSAEVLIWTAALFISSKIYDNIHHKISLQIAVVNIVKSVLYFVSVSITSWGAVCANIVWRSGHLPDLRRYTDFLGLYGGGFGFAYPDITGLWSLMFFIYANTIIYCLIKKIDSNLQKNSNYKTVFLVSVLGVLQITYYVFRSHSNNLYHIMWPAVVVIAFWIGIVVKRSTTAPDYLTVTALAATASTTMVVVFSSLLSLTGMSNTLMGYIINNNLDLNQQIVLPDNNDRISSEATNARKIIKKYAKTNKIPLLINEGVASEVILGSGWINDFQITFEEQDSLIRSGIEGIIKSATELPFESYIYIGKDTQKLSPLKITITEELCRRGHLTIVDQNDVLDVTRLQERVVPGQGDWCDSRLDSYILNLRNL